MKVKNFLINNVALVGLAMLIVLGTCIQTTFISLENISNLLRSASITGLLSVGMTFTVLCGSIDLSVASVFAMSGYLMLSLSGYSVTLALLVPLLFGAAVGVINGFLIHRLSIPPFIGTLATQLFVRGIVQTATNQEPYKVKEIPKLLLFLCRGNLPGEIPVPFVIFVVLALGMAFVLKKRFIGRSMYIVGGNAEAATMMGVSVFKTLTAAHVFCGIFAAAAGMLYTSRVGIASPIAGTGYEMYAIAAVVIGGASLNGGIGKMSGSFIGALIMASFANIFKLQTLLGAVWEDVAIGVVLLAVIIVQALITMEGGRRSHA